MDASFWHQKWESGDIAFHEGRPNSFLVEHFAKLNLRQGSRVFLPLCGKTCDVAWLLAQGYQVVGAELSQLAITQLFVDLQIQPAITELGELYRYSAQGIDILVGDIFKVSAQQLGVVDAIYDRAALVALPAELRRLYTSHLLQITAAAPQLLVSFEYDQLLIAGPPFSIDASLVSQYYGDVYQLEKLQSQLVAGGLKGKVPATETVWMLQAL